MDRDLIFTSADTGLRWFSSGLRLGLLQAIQKKSKTSLAKTREVFDGFSIMIKPSLDSE
jgi:hypothetical protein